VRGCLRLFFLKLGKEVSTAEAALTRNSSGEISTLFPSKGRVTPNEQRIYVLLHRSVPDPGLASGRRCASPVSGSFGAVDII